MKFWHKTFLSVLAIFLISFDIGAYLLIHKGYSINSDLAIRAGVNDFYSVSQMIKISLPDFKKNVSGSVLPLFESIAENYKQQNIGMEIYENEKLLFSDFLKFKDSRTELKSKSITSVYRMINGKLYLFTSGDLGIDQYQLVVIRDVDFLIAYNNEIWHYFIFISITISVLLSIILISTLLKLLRPFHKLNQVANDMAEGNFSIQAKINSSDEIGDFAKSFNKMANAVSHHIEALKLSNEEKERFSNNLTHELKTPLAIIKGYSEMLCRANISEQEKHKAYTNIYVHSLRLQQLTEKLIDLLRLKNETIIKKKIPIHKLFAEVVQLSYENLKSKGLTVESEILWDELYGDEILIKVLIMNLMENAIKASKQNGKILLRSLSPSSIEITDFGLGIPEEEITKITEEFYRVDKSRSRENGGIGLGLSICKQIVDLHDAKMLISSSFGEFTTIKIIFTTNLQLSV